MQHATFNLWSNKKVYFAFAILLSLVGFSVGHAAPVFSTVSTSTTTTTATVKIKAKVPTQVESANLSLLKYPISFSSEINQGEFSVATNNPLATDGSFQERFSGLAQGTKYLVRVSYTKPGYTGLSTEDLGDVTTKGQSLAQSPVYFVTATANATTNSIQISVANNGTATVNALIVAKNTATGVEAGRVTSTISAGSQNTVSITGLQPGTGYTLILTGTQAGSTQSFQTVSYAITTQVVATVTDPQNTNPQTTTQNQNTSTPNTGVNQCNDGIDNDGDGKADHYGVDTNGDGSIDLEPDPSCFSPNATEEKKDDVKSEIIPCTDKCTFTDVFRLLNQFLTFFITKLLIPIFIIIIMYAGYQYIMAQGNASKKANLKSMLQHIIGGIILILCAWLIVRTIMVTLLNEDFKSQGVEFLQQ